MLAKYNRINLWICVVFLFSLPVCGYAAENVAMPPSQETCEQVVSHANKGQLDKILIDSEPWDSTQIKMPEDYSKEPWKHGGVIFKKLIDINNDGILERVFVESMGTLRITNFYAYELDKDHEIAFKNARSDDTQLTDIAFIEFQGVTYILGKRDQSLDYLLHVSPNNKMDIVCEFGQRLQPIQRLKTSQNDKVCKQALKDHIKYIEFNKPHSVSYEDVKAQLAGHYSNAGIDPSEEAALIDINNDGKKEYVIQLSMESGAGRGCAYTFLSVLTANGAEIDKKLTEKLPSGL